MSDIKQKVHELISSYRDDIISGIRSIVAIESAAGEKSGDMPFGEGPAAALKEALLQGESLGFKTKNLDNFSGYAEIGSGDKIIGMLGHVDTVPVGPGWTRAPLGGEVADGFIYGRGVCDNKGACIASLYALKAVEELGVDVKKRVRAVFGANEETGMKCMEHYREKEGDFEYAFAPDGVFPVAFGEKGIYMAFFTGDVSSGCDVKLLDIFAGEAFNVVAPYCEFLVFPGDKEAGIKTAFGDYLAKNDLKGAFEKREENIFLRIEGMAAHASRPEEGLNAISHAMVFLSGIISGSPFIDAYNECVGLGYYGAGCGVDLSDPYGRLTFNVGMIRMTGSEVKASMDIRYPVTIKDFSPHEKSITDRFGKYGVRVDVSDHMPPLFHDPELPFVKSLYDVYTNMTGDIEHPPFVMGGGTYSRKFDQSVTFGYQFPGEDNFIHAVDERINIDNLLLSTEILTHAVLRLLEL